MSNKFQSPPKRKRASETSADDEYEQQLSLPAQRVSTGSDKLQSDMKTTVSEPIQPVRKMTVGSVSLLKVHLYHKYIDCFRLHTYPNHHFLCFDNFA